MNTGETAMARPAYKRKVKNYLLDVGLQLRYTATIVMIAIVLTVILGKRIYEATQDTSKVILWTGLVDEAVKKELETNFAQSDRTVLLGIIGFAAMAHSGWAAGIGRRLLDELAKKVHGGVGRTGTLAESESFHEQYAKAEATYRSARALVHETWTGISESLDAGRPLTTRQQTLMRLGMANITWSCHEVADFVYKTAGTVAWRAGTIQRLFRDMHAGTQHITSAPLVFRGTGRELAGLATGKKWVFLDLVNEA